MLDDRPSFDLFFLLLYLSFCCQILNLFSLGFQPVFSPELVVSLPEDICLCCSYVAGLEAWCIYKAKSKEAGEKVKDFLREKVPEMETEVKPVLQFYPPSPDLYALMHTLVTTQ